MHCETTTPLIKLTDVSMHWGNHNPLTDVNLTVNKGDFFAITGPNGGGKTTLLRIILKLLKPTTGTVTYFDGTAPVERLAIGYLPQKNMIDSHYPITLREVVTSGLLSIKGLSKEEINRRVDETLRTVELTEHARRSIGELSGGQLQRGLLGRAIISNPDVLVLDEPLSYIDKHFEQHIYEIIRRLAESATIILVSHEMSMISSMANRHLIVDRTIHECTAHHHYVKSECE